MQYFDIIIPFVGGLGLFIYGMQIMSSGLQNAAGTKMKKLLEMLTNNKFLGVLMGAFITAIIQSSSATTVMVVGFVNAGIMNLSQAIGVIMGANIGTTATGWIVSSVEWAKFLSPTVIAPIVVMAGVILMVTAKNTRYKEIASIIVGFGILFIGIQMMSDAVYPLRSSQKFKDLFLLLGANPVFGVLAGAVITAIIQSSSASVGILQTLAASGLVPFNAAVYIIMGQNIGTCVTAMLSGIGASRNAKCAAYMHLLFNVIGTVLFSVLAVIFFKVINPLFGSQLITQTQISGVHTVFNVANTVLLFPFSGFIIALAKKIAHAKAEEEVDETRLVHLDDRVLETPSFAVQSAVKEVVRLGYIVEENLNLAKSSLIEREEQQINDIFKREKTIDSLCDAITNYLVKICNIHINDHETSVVTSLLHIVSDMERVGDHCENIAELTQLMIREETSFSEEASAELIDMFDKSIDSYINSVQALESSNVQYAYNTVRLEDLIDDLESKLRISHIHRLAKNQCSAASGIVFLDALTNLERISDHAMNIAEMVINDKRETKKLIAVTE